MGLVKGAITNRSAPHFALAVAEVHVSEQGSR